VRAQRIQDRICTLAKEGRWQEIVVEKRAALQQIKHTLDTYHRLLTQAPVPADGVLKLLQSIVRCALPAQTVAHMSGANGCHLDDWLQETLLYVRAHSRACSICWVYKVHAGLQGLVVMCQCLC